MLAGRVAQVIGGGAGAAGAAAATGGSGFGSTQTSTQAATISSIAPPPVAILGGAPPALAAAGATAAQSTTAPGGTTPAVRGSHAASIVDRPLPRGAAAAGGGGRGVGGLPLVGGGVLGAGGGGGGGGGAGGGGAGGGGDLPTVSLSAYAHLFTELIAYSMDRSASIAELEDRLTRVGHDVGLRLAELLPWRAAAGDARVGGGGSGAGGGGAAGGAGLPVGGGSLLGAGASMPRRHAEPLDALKFVHSVAWPALFGKPADDLQQAHAADDEFMIADHDLLLHRHVSVPRRYSAFVPGSLAAGVVGGLLAGFGLPAAVSAHSVEFKGRDSTTILVKFDASVMKRRAYVAGGGAGR